MGFFGEDSPLSSLREPLAHVLWIGGPPDAGKTTAARILAERHRCTHYEYDIYEHGHQLALARKNSEYEEFLSANMDERWVHPTPEQLLLRTTKSHFDRMPFVWDELMALPDGRPIIAEGAGLHPDFVLPLISHPNQAVWQFPSPTFKGNAMDQPAKQEFFRQSSDPLRARANLVARDELLARAMRVTLDDRPDLVLDVNESSTPDGLAARLEQHFGPLLN